MKKKVILIGTVEQKDLLLEENIYNIRTQNDLKYFLESEKEIAYFHGIDEKSFIERFKINFEITNITLTSIIDYAIKNLLLIPNGFKIELKNKRPIIDANTIHNMCKFEKAINILEETARMSKKTPLSLGSDEVQNTYKIDISEKAEYLLEELEKAAEELPIVYEDFYEFYQDWTGNFMGMYSKINDICLFIIKSPRYDALVRKLKNKYDFNLNLSVFLEATLINEQTQITENDTNITLNAENNLREVNFNELPSEKEFKKKAINLKNSGKFEKLGYAQNALAVKYGFKDYNSIKIYFKKSNN